MTELSESLCLDLTDTLTGDIELLTNLLEGMGSAVLKAVTKLEDLILTGSESIEDLSDLLAEHCIGCRILRSGAVVIGDEIAEVGILLKA